LELGARIRERELPNEQRVQKRKLAAIGSGEKGKRDVATRTTRGDSEQEGRGENGTERIARSLKSAE